MKTATKKSARLTPLQKQIRASVEAAKRILEAKADPRNPMRKAVKAAGSDATRQEDETIFGALSIYGPSFLDRPDMLEIVQERAAEAVAAKDGNWLIRLGRALQGQGSGTEPRFENVDMMMVGLWLPGEIQNCPAGPCGLCDFTDHAMRDFLNRYCGNQTVDAVTKRRQRLGLVKSPDPVVTAVKNVNGKWVYTLSTKAKFVF